MSDERPIRIAQPEPPGPGHRVLAWLERGFLYVDRLIERWLPPRLNPLSQTGAIANVSFLIALVSGILLLFWYVPSVHQAWGSLEEAGWLGQWMRSLHRYSSDATMFFVLVHALRMWFARRFAGARWVAWVTGVAALAILWFTGWLGYWLVWDERAHLIATGSAKLVDILPIFTEPLSRTFLVDQMVSSALFFIIFFIHMVLPLAMGVALWIHISRVSRARFLANRPMTLWVTGTMMALSAIVPADSAGKALMSQLPHSMNSDWWYLLPLALTERLSAGALWAIVLLGTLLVGSIPWLMAREKPQKVTVDTKRCNSCTLCVQDCPYDAIIMVPRTDGRDRYDMQAQVDPNKCVGCGICAGSCNPGAIGLPQMPVGDKRRQIDTWIDEMLADEQAPSLAFLCGGAAGAEFTVDAEGRSKDLPGWRVMAVTCAGWVHALTIERALRRGAEHILIVGCRGHDPYYREGTQWLADRIKGLREPALRREKVDASRVHFLTLNRTESGELKARAQAILAANHASAASSGRARRWIAGVGLAAALSAAVVIPADLPSLVPERHQPELAVTFKIRPDPIEQCRTLSDAEKAELPVHMRRDAICDRTRPDIVAEVLIDGERIHRGVYPPAGLSGGGPSFGIERFAVAPGERRVEVRLGTTLAPGEWLHRHEATLRFEKNERRVVRFEQTEGFSID